MKRPKSVSHIDTRSSKLLDKLKSSPTLNTNSINYELIQLILYNPNPTIEAIRQLIEKGANVNTQNYIRDTVLHNVIMFESYIHIIEFLFECGANLNIQNMQGETPLHLLMKYDHHDTQNYIEWFLAHGADPNIKNNVGSTAFHILMQFEHIKIGRYIKLLLKYGASTEIRNKDGKLPKDFGSDNVQCMFESLITSLKWQQNNGVESDITTVLSHGGGIMSFQRPNVIPVEMDISVPLTGFSIPAARDDTLCNL